MSGKVVVVSDDSDTEEAETDDVVDALEDVVMDSTTIQLVERVARLEDALTLQAAAIEALQEQVSSVAVTTEMLESVDVMQEEEIQAVQSEVMEMAEETADAVENVVEDIDEASEEIKPDEIPTIREHPFFKRWGKGS